MRHRYVCACCAAERESVSPARRTCEHCVMWCRFDEDRAWVHREVRNGRLVETGVQRRLS